MTEGLIGVIVPVYKVEKYIAECIESILAQTYTKFRLILVDDGSPDNAGKICDEYAKKDSRITVIHQENAGVTRARARGVEEAEDCEWITFVDGDDTISKNHIEEFYNVIEERYDIVINEDHIQIKQIPIEEYRHIIISAAFKFNIAPWNKLFRKQLFTKHTFDIPREIVVGEDLIMNLRLSFSSIKDNIAVINKDTYNYRCNSESISHSYKRTPEYEYLFNNIVITSIPEGQISTYITDTIKNRLINFRRFWGYSYNAKGMKSSPFYQELKKDIIRTNFKLPIIDRIIFNYTNIVIRFIAINIKKILNKLS